MKIVFQSTEWVHALTRLIDTFQSTSSNSRPTQLPVLKSKVQVVNNLKFFEPNFIQPAQFWM